MPIRAPIGFLSIPSGRERRLVFGAGPIETDLQLAGADVAVPALPDDPPGDRSLDWYRGRTVTPRPKPCRTSPRSDRRRDRPQAGRFPDETHLLLVVGHGAAHELLRAGRRHQQVIERGHRAVVKIGSARPHALEPVRDVALVGSAPCGRRGCRPAPGRAGWYFTPAASVVSNVVGTLAVKCRRKSASPSEFSTRERFGSVPMRAVG